MLPVIGKMTLGHIFDYASTYNASGEWLVGVFKLGLASIT